MYFIQNSSLLDSLENVFSEHLELLKFQTFSKSFTPKLMHGGLEDLQQHPRPLSCIAGTLWHVWCL